jgi:hypothetical protein
MEFNGAQLSDLSLRRYLIGLSDEAERAKIEEAFLTDNLSEQRLSLIEDELIEDYFDGSLDTSEVDRFDELFLRNSDRREKLFVISSLREGSYDQELNSTKTVNKRGPVPLDQRRLAIVGVFGIAAVGLVVFLAIRVNSLTKELQVAIEERNDAAEGVSGTLRKAAPTDRSGIQYLRMVPDGTRGRGLMNRLRLVPTAATLVLEIPAKSTNFDEYRVSMRTPDDEEVSSESKLRVDDSGYVRFIIPAQGITVGDYEVRLIGRTIGHRFQEILSCPLRISN